MSLLDEALAISRELGMKPLLERVSALREGAGSHPGRTPEFPAGLTRREVEVLQLLAQGMSNRRIAGELALSERTVQRHVANLYGKIDAHNRAEATTFALTRLFPPTQNPPGI